MSKATDKRNPVSAMRELRERKQWPAGKPPERIQKTQSNLEKSSSGPKKTGKNPKTQLLPPAPESDADQPDVTYCLSCSGIVDDDKQTTQSIQCDYCDGWVHARSMCSGLNAEAYRVLSENKNLMYKCSKCLTRKNTTRNSCPFLAQAITSAKMILHNSPKW